MSDLPTGGKEVVIQGDVYFDVPALLINEFKVLLVLYLSVVYCSVIRIVKLIVMWLFICIC